MKPCSAYYSTHDFSQSCNESIMESTRVIPFDDYFPLVHSILINNHIKKHIITSEREHSKKETIKLAANIRRNSLHKKKLTYSLSNQLVNTRKHPKRFVLTIVMFVISIIQLVKKIFLLLEVVFTRKHVIFLYILIVLQLFKTY